MKEKATEVTGCNTCKGGFSKSQWGLLILGLYMGGSAVYTTILLIKKLINFMI